MEKSEFLINTNASINFDLSLDMVQFEYNCPVSQASIGQIIKSLNSVVNLKAKNIYEITLYSKFNSFIPQFIEEYNKLLKCTNQFEYLVKYYILIVQLPYGVEIPINNHNYINLGKPRIGELIKAARQRISFIIEREIPMVYQILELYRQEYLKMIEQLKDFLIKLNEFEKDFVNAIDLAHKAQQKFYNY